MGVTLKINKTLRIKDDPIRLSQGFAHRSGLGKKFVGLNDGKDPCWRSVV
jgi:hypothetical protein